MNTPKYCVDCIWSKQDPTTAWALRCSNPTVNSKNAWSLGSPKIETGVSCTEERSKTWLAPCGMRGAKWELKP